MMTRHKPHGDDLKSLAFGPQEIFPSSLADRSNYLQHFRPELKNQNHIYKHQSVIPSKLYLSWTILPLIYFIIENIEIQVQPISGNTHNDFFSTEDFLLGGCCKFHHSYFYLCQKHLSYFTQTSTVFVPTVLTPSLDLLALPPISNQSAHAEGLALLNGDGDSVFYNKNGLEFDGQDQSYLPAFVIRHNQTGCILSTIQTRQALVDLVFSGGLSIGKAARKLRVKLSTAKMIVKRFRLQGDFFESKRQKQERLFNLKKRLDSQRENNSGEENGNREEKGDLSVPEAQTPVEEKPLTFLPMVMNEMHYWPWVPIQSPYFYPGFSFEIPQAELATCFWQQANTGQ